MGALWSIYELVLSYMIHSYMYPWECMYLRKRKIIRQLWSIKSTITWNRTYQEFWSFGSEISLRMESNRTEQENNKTTFPNEEGCYGCNTKSTRYSGYSGNVPGLHILLQVKLLTPFTSGLPFLLFIIFPFHRYIHSHRYIYEHNHVW